LAVLRQSFSWSSAGSSLPLPIVALTLTLVAGQWPGWSELFVAIAPQGSLRRYAVYGAAATVAILLIPVATIDFIYFQF
jgi:hypothetical protein